MGSNFAPPIKFLNYLVTANGELSRAGRLPAGRFDRQARTARLQRIVGRRHSFVAPPGKTLAEQLAVERRVFVRRSTGIRQKKYIVI